MVMRHDRTSANVSNRLNLFSLNDVAENIDDGDDDDE
jgi:hypothetical protein